MWLPKFIKKILKTQKEKEDKTQEWQDRLAFRLTFTWKKEPERWHVYMPHDEFDLDLGGNDNLHLHKIELLLLNKLYPKEHFGQRYRMDDVG